MKLDSTPGRRRTRPLRRRGRAVVLLLLLGACAALVRARDVPRIEVHAAAQRVEVSKAVLIDVREPSEWRETGVAAPAVLLPMSDFDGEREAWTPFLRKYPPSACITLILYCRSGRRADAVGAALAAMGYAVANAGGFDDWRAAGLPVRHIEPR